MLNRRGPGGRCLNQIMGQVFQEQAELFHHKAKGHDSYGGPDPSQERSFIGQVDPAIMNPDLFYLGIFSSHTFLRKAGSPDTRSI